MMDLKKTIIYSLVIWAQSQVHVTPSRYRPSKRDSTQLSIGLVWVLLPMAEPHAYGKKR